MLDNLELLNKIRSFPENFKYEMGVEYINIQKRNPYCTYIDYDQETDNVLNILKNCKNGFQIYYQILIFLPLEDLRNLASVSKQIRHIINIYISCKLKFQVQEIQHYYVDVKQKMGGYTIDTTTLPYFWRDFLNKPKALYIIRYNRYNLTVEDYMSFLEQELIATNTIEYKFQNDAKDVLQKLLKIMKIKQCFRTVQKVSIFQDKRVYLERISDRYQGEYQYKILELEKKYPVAAQIICYANIFSFCNTYQRFDINLKKIEDFGVARLKIDKLEDNLPAFKKLNQKYSQKLYYTPKKICVFKKMTPNTLKNIIYFLQRKESFKLRAVSRQFSQIFDSYMVDMKTIYSLRSQKYLSDLNKKNINHKDMMSYKKYEDGIVQLKQEDFLQFIHIIHHDQQFTRYVKLLMKIVDPSVASDINQNENFSVRYLRDKNIIQKMIDIVNTEKRVDLREFREEIDSIQELGELQLVQEKDYDEEEYNSQDEDEGVNEYIQIAIIIRNWIIWNINDVYQTEEYKIFKNYINDIRQNEQIVKIQSIFNQKLQ